MTQEGAIHLGEYGETIEGVVQRLRREGIGSRILAHDHTVWKPSPIEIVDRLGWLNPADMEKKIPGLEGLAEDLGGAGYRNALLLGMGGSSLIAEVLSRTFGRRDGYLDLAVLDSTDPGLVLHYAECIDLPRTLFIVATKSGGTVETFSFMKYCYNLTEKALGKGQAGQHFIAITDPGSDLARVASEHDFRATLLNDPHIGGRYSALSYFGLVPAALLGMDVKKFLASAVAARAAEFSESGGIDGLYLGVTLGELAKIGRDKLTFFPSPGIAAFGVWLEQLFAESTGKEGKGILPVVGEPLREPTAYVGDRVFVFLNLKGDAVDTQCPEALRKAGHPVITLSLDDRYDLGAQCFLWEMATAIAGSRLGINPFDQPDVETAKKLARTILATYKSQGALPEEPAQISGNDVLVYTDLQASTPREALDLFLKQTQKTGYVAIHAYLRPTPDTDAALTVLRRVVGRRTGLATTLGYGPRFLHSTGQLHKGDAGRGLFIQITAQDERDAAIPDEMGKPGSSLTFGTLKAAQAAGDRQALLVAGRRVIRFHLKKDVASALRQLAVA